MNSKMSYLTFMLGLAVACTLVGCREAADQTVATSAVANPKTSDSYSELAAADVEQETTPAQKQVPPQNDEKVKSDVDDNSVANVQESETVTDQELPKLDDVLNKPRKDEVDPYAGGGEAKTEVEKQTIDIPKSWKRLSEQQEIWVDLQKKEVIVAGNICMRAGALEVFACPRRTKEHEAIVSVNASSRQVHGALLAVGANPGHPVRWEEDNYTAATGPVIKIMVMWKEGEDVKSRPAQELVKNITTDEIMKLDWVFAGSETYTDPDTGEVYYFGDSGEMVCLSNFSTATMDVPVKSAESNAGLLFGANTENIPELGTKVYLVMKPVLKNEPKQSDKKEADNVEPQATSKDSEGASKNDKDDDLGD